LDPLNDVAKRARAIALATMGDQLWQSGQITEPMRYYQRSRSSFQELVSRSPNVARTRYLLDLLCERMAVVYLAKSDLGTAEQTAREGLSISKDLSAADPRDAQAGLTLAEDSRLVADLESRRGHNRSAAAEIRTAVTVSKRLAEASPRDTETLAIEAGAYRTAGDIAVRSGHFSAALPYYESAIAVLTKIFSQNSGNAGAGARLSAMLNSAGKTKLLLHRSKEATNDFQKSLAIIEPITKSAYPSGQALYAAADAYAGLGQIEEADALTMGEKTHARGVYLKRAAVWYERSSEEWARIQEPAPVSPDGFDCIPREVISRKLIAVQKKADAATDGRSFE
jgi:tetratricopeptide (TPR) repeat protein